MRSSGSRLKFLIRLGHFQHGMVVLFMREFARNLPALTKIELHGYRIGLNNAEAAGVVAAASYFRFTFCE